MGEPPMDAKHAASRLTALQRAMLLKINGGQPGHYVLGSSGLALVRCGLVFVNKQGWRYPTVFGHQVIRVLKAKSA